MARGLPKRSPIPGVDNIVVVASGKGGVGKSTIAANLAVSLASLGKRVGLLDGDIFGPSIPLMLNLKEEPLINNENLMIPPVNYGVKCLSMGLLSQSGAMIWRGPLVMSALQRLLKGAAWGPLDVLIVDTPPGTGDVHLSLAQNVPISGVLLVSTPQTAALEITARGAEMYKTLKIPIFGLAENMGYVVCTKCETKMNIFKNVTKKFADDMGTGILVSVPIDAKITDCCDEGTPMVAKYPDSIYAESFRHLAKKILEKLQPNI
ncbi:iron-sulfur protein NUBPL isoform X2 [Episyrphus balteatus]|nr:iron-sulfur protein NUBPL isoform X2 [Episyrphus balteatus]